MSSALDKKIVRQTILTNRKKLSTQHKIQASQKILSQLMKWDIFKRAKVIHTFLNHSDEIQTFPIVQQCWQQEKTVIVPYLIPNSKKLGHSILFDMEHLMLGTWDIPEPRLDKRKSIDSAAIDLVLVPGVGFDDKANRIGYGAGYYDRFLEQLSWARQGSPQPSAFLLGLGFQCQIIEEVPQEDHDIKMDNILTEDGFIKSF